MSEATIHLVRDSSQASDHSQRARALELSQTFIVRAPAGSGKTDLLTRRFLKSLAVVTEPEEILAITFTRAATAEMRTRVLKHLEEAARSLEPAPNEDERVTLARAALRNSDARGWRILEQPQRLTIETIDSLCLRIAHGQPLLSRMGGRLNPVERADLLYGQAARHTLGQLGGPDAVLSEAIAHLLELRDNSLQDCERLIADMLKNRDQWVRAFPLVEAIDWDVLRLELERPFKEEVKRGIDEVHKRIAAETVLAAELVELADYAAANCMDFGLLARMGALPSPEQLALDHWHCIADFLLTQGGTWRKSVTVRQGFPASGSQAKEWKRRMEWLLLRLQEIAGLHEALLALKELPLPCYDEDQWTTLRHLFMTLRRAVAELNVIFAERNVVDFPQLNISARQVLRDADEDPDVLLALSGGLRHLLVDEFQDTSRSQFELIRLLVRAWNKGDGRTCFFVGDPMQSIYMFRQAEVELFRQVEQKGIESESAIECELVQLSTNFRSHAGLTDEWNAMFAAVFGPDAPVPFSPSHAAEPALVPDAVKVYPQVVGATDRAKATSEEKNDAQEREALQVREIIEKHLPAITKAQAAGSEYRVAVLVRARQHLAKLVRLLRQRGIAFRGVEIETLAERQELLDLLSLVRALLHPMDRVAWLAVLRAPWCGLTLRDLHALTGADDRTMRKRPMLELIEERAGLLDTEAAERASRVVGILKQALAMRFAGIHAGSFSQWIERTWRSLGGPLCVDAAAYENVQTFFAMMDETSPDGMACMTAEFDAELEWLFAQPDPPVSESAGVQLMTIHKAKGLGFDVVIVPGLDRKAAADPSSLIVSLERTNEQTGQDEMLVAPIGAKGGETHPTYKWVQKQRTARQDEEIKRLLYVACTRAQRELHLLGTATLTQSGLKGGDAKSLLDVGWPAFEPTFLDALKKKAQAKVLDFPLEMAYQGELFSLAAVSEERGPRLTLKRLPLGTDFRPRGKNITAADTFVPGDVTQLARPEGSRRARVVGNAVHALLDQLSRGLDAGQIELRARAMLRAAAFSGRALDEALSEVLGAVENCGKDPVGRWILEQHAGAQSETSWTGWAGDEMMTVRADRVFRSGAEPRQVGEDHLWIVDYKMSDPQGKAIEEFLAKQREYYAPQLEKYAKALRQIEGADTPVRMGLYYPRIATLDWWV
ncbi:MAG TPA: UvrD-helicase domain-containing protein [Silvibacterium sp.]|nr:UvrD-helicase domain-containing protein [Silvibacterium sp.]